ncbi:MAG: prolyl oligopeptidase family serine peptidase [Brachybacterium sp.]|uniref:prolyl oligopeptidase family serine peptidase n=1 Tax=Brachybacterium sp. TaxID=1891286 RepID=UPI0026494576|nr:prolyl oligopeptidase family serine peptidase [Brachybacterium sp.]MDN5687111.1 prolyl oligopeptidase family serine peptidase [Brachybacterium sp.]
MTQEALASIDASQHRAPHPARDPQSRTVHGDTVVTEHSWLRDRRSPDVAAHLVAENAYTDARTAHLATLVSALTRDLAAPRPAEELGVPVRSGSWWYIDRPREDEHGTDLALSRIADQDVRIGSGGVPILPAGELGEHEELLIAGRRATPGFALSTDQDLLARAEISTGGCAISITDLTSGEVIDQSIRDAGADLGFSHDGQWLLYTHLDDLGRSHQVRRHRIGTPEHADEVLLEETDPWGELRIARSRDGSSLLIRSQSIETTETWLLDLADPTGPLSSITGRRAGARPALEHAGDRLLVIDQDDDGRDVLGETSLPGRDGSPAAQTLLTAGDGEEFESVEAFAGFAALQVRAGGLPGVRIIRRRADGSFDALSVRALGHGGQLDAVRLDANPSWTQSTVRYRVDSLLTPTSLAETDVATDEVTVLHQVPFPGFDAAQYLERRLWATASDGTAVPISVLARRDVLADGPAPGLLYGDGAYGTSLDPALGQGALALADRGLVVAIAHVRGGGEMGGDWHLAGRRLAKDASFDDFISCAEHLTATGWVAEGRLGAVGMGAGGLLVAASANRAPSAFRAIIAGAPLVDPLATLLDPEVMLTLEEWMEWGDPVEDEAIYHHLRGYSPAENVPETEFPAVFAWTALEGTDIPPTEAAVWVAQLRARITSDPTQRPVLLRSLPAVHGAAVEAHAESMAWLLDQLDVPGIRA